MTTQTTTVPTTTPKATTTPTPKATTSPTPTSAPKTTTTSTTTTATVNPALAQALAQVKSLQMIVDDLNATLGALQSRNAHLRSTLLRAVLPLLEPTPIPGAPPGTEAAGTAVDEAGIAVNSNNDMVLRAGVGGRVLVEGHPLDPQRDNRTRTALAGLLAALIETTE